MSSLENELSALQEKNWSEKEREMVKSLIENVKYYRKLIPNSLKKDICEAIQMCNSLKIELDTYREFCKNKGITYSDGKITLHDNVECKVKENDTTVIDTTVIDTTVIDTTVIDTTVIDTTAIDTTAIDTTVIDTTAIDTTVIDTTVIDTTAIDTTAIDTTVIDTTAIGSCCFTSE